MDVGNGHFISDEWIPKGIDTGLKDINGKTLKTSDKVQLNGCYSRYAIIGLRFLKGNEFALYFGGRHGSVSWGLDDETIAKHKIRQCD